MKLVGLRIVAVTLLSAKRLLLKLEERSLGFPVAVLLLCALFLMSSCATHVNEVSWEKDRPLVLASVRHSEKDVKRLQVLQGQAAHALEKRITVLEHEGREQRQKVDLLMAKIQAMQKALPAAVVHNSK